MLYTEIKEDLFKITTPKITSQNMILVHLKKGKNTYKKSKIETQDKRKSDCLYLCFNSYLQTLDSTSS